MLGVAVIQTDNISNVTELRVKRRKETTGKQIDKLATYRLC